MPSEREEAGLPPYPELRWVTLQTMRRMPLPASNAEIDEAVADALGLTEKQRGVMHKQRSVTRQTELAYRVAWARTALKVAGAIDNTGRAVWTVTTEGYQIRHEAINQRYEAHLAERAAQRKDNQRTSRASVSLGGSERESPADVDWKEQLIERLGNLPPSGFEQLTGRLLVAAGFHDVKVVGQSGDGGIDCVGMYRLSLVSFPTYVQCKRYQGAVGAGMVRDLRGAMAGRGDRGLLITTGTFTSGAQSEATRGGALPIELIDGDTLCELLKQYQLGVKVTQRTVEDVDIDDEYFGRFDQ